MASILAGCAISVVLDVFMAMLGVAYYFPPFWPGLFFSLTVIIASRGESWANGIHIALVTVGNAAFYTWVSLRVLKAEVVSRGPLGRRLLR